MTDALERKRLLHKEAEEATALAKEQRAMMDALTMLSNEYLFLEVSMKSLNQDVVLAQAEIGAYTDTLAENADAVEVAEHEIDLTAGVVQNLTGAIEDGANASEDLTRGLKDLSNVLSLAILTYHRLQ